MTDQNLGENGGSTWAVAGPCSAASWSVARTVPVVALLRDELVENKTSSDGRGGD
jgi:hypothetical protein